MNLLPPSLVDAAAALPFAALQRVANAVFAVVARNHPRLFERLAGYSDARVLVAPSDLPVVFLLRLHPARPGVDVHASEAGLAPSASVRGPMLRLIDLMEGAVDGDALFFSRDLSIEGDTEVVLALRNAVEAEEILLYAEIAAALGPLGWPVRLAGEHGPGAVSALRGGLNLIAGRRAPAPSVDMR